MEYCTLMAYDYFCVHLCVPVCAFMTDVFITGIIETISARPQSYTGTYTQEPFGYPIHLKAGIIMHNTHKVGLSHLLKVQVNCGLKQSLSH